MTGDPSPDPDERRIDVEPSGFGGFYGIGLATALISAAMVLPMALIGVFGAVFWHDFHPALRLLMGVAGTGASLALVWLPIHFVTRATIWRTRIRVRPGGVFVEAGISTPRRTWWLTPRADVQAAVSERGLGGIALSCGRRHIRMAAGHTPPAREQLLRAIQRALAEVPNDPNDTHPPASERLGPTLRARLRERLRILGRDLLRPLQHPTPYLLVDLGVMALTPLMSWLTTGLLDWRDAYPIAFMVFLAGLAARHRDGSYITGLRHYRAGDMLWGFKYMLAGVVTALAGWGAMTPRLGAGLAFVLSTFTAIGLHWSLLRWAETAAPAPTPNRTLDLARSLTLVPLCVLHEAGLFTFLVDSSRNLGPLGLAFVPVLVLFGYLPLRLHAFVDDPGDRSNLAWFWVTVAALALQPLLSLGPAIAQKL